MAVLSIIVLFTTNVYNAVTKSYSSSNRNNGMNMRARAALNFMANEISQAVLDKPAGTDPFLSLCIKTGSGGNASDEVCFVAMMKDPDGTGENDNRSVNIVSYYVNDEHKLMRRLGSDAADVSGKYGQDIWGVGHEGASELVDNVIYFRVDAYDQLVGGYINQNDFPNPTSYNNRMDFLNLYIEVIDDESLGKVRLFKDNGLDIKADELVERNKKSYSKKVFFNNYQGYYL